MCGSVRRLVSGGGGEIRNDDFRCSFNFVRDTRTSTLTETLKILHPEISTFVTADNLFHLTGRSRGPSMHHTQTVGNMQYTEKCGQHTRH
jgi:hypothetical protein